MRQEEEVGRLVPECYIHPEDTARITILQSRFLESVCFQIQETKSKIIEVHKSAKFRVRAVILTALCGMVQGFLIPSEHLEIMRFSSLCRRE